jgi:hypothetical protein
MRASSRTRVPSMTVCRAPRLFTLARGELESVGDGSDVQAELAEQQRSPASRSTPLSRLEFRRREYPFGIGERTSSRTQSPRQIEAVARRAPRSRAASAAACSCHLLPSVDRVLVAMFRWGNRKSIAASPSWARTSSDLPTGQPARRDFRLSCGARIRPVKAQRLHQKLSQSHTGKPRVLPAIGAQHGLAAPMVDSVTSVGMTRARPTS